jgi:V/A-type H+-transporting ATPase subunit F
MPRVLILTDQETAAGFRLAGVEVAEADQESAHEVLGRAITEDDYGLIVVDESLIDDPNKAAERVMRGRDLPVLLSMPGLGSAFVAEDDALAYMQELVRSAIGFDIKLE